MGTLEMINIIKRAHRDLKSMGLEREISNSTIVSMIEERLPEAIEKEWIKTVTNTLQPEIIKDKFPALLDLLLAFRERRGTWGGSEHRNTAKKLTNTASPQEKSTKHRHRKSKTRIFSKKSKQTAVTNITRQGML